MSEMKIEPEELCGSSFTQNIETKTTCSTTGQFYIKCSITLILLKIYKLFFY